MNAEQPRVLCVDDEARVLEGLESNLGWDYDVFTAEGGAQGLDVLESEGPFAVVISDMRMPGMDGATFLSQVRRRAPDTTRMLLTGYADVDAAMAAVNEGRIFRFLSKPCGPEILVPAVRAATEQNRLVRAEKELLEQTLAGSVRVLTEILGLAAPAAFSRSNAVKAYVKHMIDGLELPQPWHYELAAMLSQLGCVTLPPETLERLYGAESLSPAEQKMVDRHPGVGRDLLQNVPRLEFVAEIIGRQADKPPRTLSIPPTSRDEHITLGVALLRLAQAVDRRVLRGSTVLAAVTALRKEKFHPVLLDALQDCTYGEDTQTIKGLAFHELRPRMVLVEDVRARNGNVLLAKDRELTRPLIERLGNFYRSMGLIEPILVRVAGD